MKKLIIVLFLSIPVLLSAQRIRYGIGVDYIFGQHFMETEDYRQIYEGKEALEPASIRPTKDVFILMKTYAPNRAMNIPIFMKVTIGKFNIIPTISIPTVSIGRNDIEIKSIEDRPEWKVTRPRGEAGNRGWDYGSDFYMSGDFWRAEAKLSTWRIGGYVTHTTNAWEFGTGFFYDIRNYEIFHWTYGADYRYDHIDYSNNEYVYYLDELNVWNCYYGMTRNDLREDAIEINKVKMRSIEIPIYVSVGWNNFRVKAECIFSKELYGSLGLEFIFN